MRKVIIGFAAAAMAFGMVRVSGAADDAKAKKVSGVLIDDSCAAKFTSKDNPEEAAAKHPAACAVKCLGGVIQGRLAPRDDDERGRAVAAGHDLKQVLTTDDLVASEDAFFAATGITDGELLAGVRYRAGGATTQSLVMRARSGTTRTITSEHQLWKLRAYSAFNFDGPGQRMS